MYTIIPLFLGNIRGWEWIVILVVILLLFGGKKIPELMRGLGKGVRSFKSGMNEIENEINADIDTPKTSNNTETTTSTTN